MSLPLSSSLSSRLLRRFLLLLLALGAAGCTVMDRSRGNTVALEAGARWAILPLANHTETPQAGLRAEVILESLLRQRGLQSVERPPAVAVNDLLGESPDNKLRQDGQRFFANSRFRFEGGLIAEITEYWGTWEAPPAWRTAEAIGAYRRDPAGDPA